MTRDELEAIRDELQAAMYSGELSARDSDGKQVTYRSMTELRAALSALNRQLSGLSQQRVPRSFRINAIKGVS